MHFVRTKEKVIQSTSATEVKELPILNLHKKELITTACEQLDSCFPGYSTDPKTARSCSKITQ